MQTKVWVKVRLLVIHPDGTKITYEEVRSRVRRLLDEYESAIGQPDDFYLTEPQLIGISQERPLKD